LLGAAVAYRFLPAHADGGDEELGELVDGTALRLLDDPEQRLGLARAALGLFADAGMSSLRDRSVARSGELHAGGRLEVICGALSHAVTDALAEVFERTLCPTAEICARTSTTTCEVGDVLSVPRAREILGALIAESASDPELGRSLRSESALHAGRR
jgi:hypothetical protein